MPPIKDPALLDELNSGGQIVSRASPKLPYEAPAAAAGLQGQNLSNQKTAQQIAMDQRGEQRNVSNDRYTQVTGLAKDFNSDASVKAYKVAMQQMAQALGTGTGPQADLSLTYAFAKAMDPESVVRESEQGMVTESQPWFKAAVQNAKKQFGMDGAGSYTPETREALRQQISNSVTQRVKAYDATRDYYTNQARHLGLPAELIVGEHAAKPFIPVLEKWAEQRKSLQQPKGGPALQENEFVRDGVPMYRDPQTGEETPLIVGGSVGKPYDQSPVSQGLSGVNEGIAGVAGLPVDLATFGLNAGAQGINALANTNIPTIDNPILGSQWLKEQMGNAGAIGAPAQTPGMQSVRRVGESIGASAIPAGAAGGLLRGAGQLAVGAGGGLGAAAAQRAFPGNPIAEMAGEIVGSGGTGLGLLNAGRRSAVRQMEANVPTVPQLREQAGELYRSAESRGIVADPGATQDLADTTRALFAREGRISPNGRISEVYPKAREGMQLIDDYAGTPMTPTQMQTVRQVVADGLTSKDRTERRLAGILTDNFDQWAGPMAPELGQARNVASRYLTAEQLQQARELAGARAGQFTGSGFENALRTEYRGLDRGAIKGSQRFGDDVTGAIETVSRGTPGSNAFRNIGRLAPTGPVSGMGSAVPAIGAGMATGSPTIGAAVGGLMAGAGALGRVGATRMGIRNADQAELIARNGGNLPQVPLLNPEDYPLIYRQLAAQAAKYLSGQ